MRNEDRHNDNEEPEYVDRSQWLPLKLVKQYADYAVAHGRKIFNGGSILPSCTDKLPVEWLADDKRILSESHKAAGINYRIIWECVEGRISVYGVTDNLDIAHIEPVKKKIAIECQLDPADKHIIRRVCIYPAYKQDYEQFERKAERIITAFDALVEAMKRENIQNALDLRAESGKIYYRSRAIALSKISTEAAQYS